VPLWRAGLAILRGDFERAEELSARAHELGRRAQDANADTYRVIQRIFALIEQRRFSEIDLDEYERRFASAPGGRGSSLGWLAWLHAEQGNLEPARAAFAELAADGFALLPRDANWHSACDAAEACAALGDAAAAQPLLELLRPHAALYPVIGRGIGCLGPVSYFLGLLEAARGEHAQAARHFERALAACEAIGAGPRAVLTRKRLEEALSVARRA
jgi:tetratricopeptide (TPR) repeat protein